MKVSEYYNNMKSVSGCRRWAKSVGLRFRPCGGDEQLVLPGKRGEIDLDMYYAADEDDLDFINCLNRLRRWKEGPVTFEARADL